MSAIFVHVSDIHFGQERGDRVHIHTDVKNQLIKDAAEIVRSLPGGIAHGILATGDIAQSGKHEQYAQAGEWLDSLANAIGCKTYQIQMVPGNHDLDREKLSRGAKHLLDDIREGGATEYEDILANDADRATLFARFEDYGKFSEGYDCPLDTEGKYSTNLRIELAPGRAIRFVRLNSALLCHGKENDDEPELMMGARQFTIPREAGEENIVLIHHPLNWFKDSGEANTYLRTRSRVIISGHEHNPKVNVEEVEKGSHLMMLASGATVPFKSNETYTFTYNIIEFGWDLKNDALSVTIYPRAWNPNLTRFEADNVRLGSSTPKFVLDSPNFRSSLTPKLEAVEQENSVVRQEEIEPTVSAPVIEMVAATDVEEGLPMPPQVDGYRFLLLRFFRDLTGSERLHILSELGALQLDSDEPITQAIQRQLLDSLVDEGRISEVVNRVDELTSNRK